MLIFYLIPDSIFITSILLVHSDLLYCMLSLAMAYFLYFLSLPLVLFLLQFRSHSLSPLVSVSHSHLELIKILFPKFWLKSKKVGRGFIKHVGGVE